MITPSTIYWLTRASEIKNLLQPEFGSVVLFIMFGATMAVTAMVMYDISDSDINIVKKIFKYSSIGMGVVLFRIFFGLVAASFVPTTKELCAMIVVPKIANSESVQNIGKNIVNLAQDWMETLAPSNVINKTF